MITCLLTKPVKTQHNRLISLLESIKEDLARFSGYVSELSCLSHEQLESLEIEDQVKEIHRCLKRFEVHYMANRILSNEDVYTQLSSDDYETTFPKSTGDWNAVRREAKRASKLTSQLTKSINKIRTGLGENQDAGIIPKDILQIKQTFRNVVNDIGSDDLLIHG
jgi:hypothetical protein